jgi:hypothetical protein
LVDARIALSLDTLVDSALTLAARSDRYAADVDADGFNPLHQYNLLALQEGYGSLFLQKNAENARTYMKAPKSVFAEGSSTSESWRDLDQLVALIRKHGIDARFVIYPYHAHILEMFRHAGLMRAFDDWKRQLSDIVGASGDGCRLWDFSGYTAYATEPVPAPGDRRSEMRWYWESGHFKRELGDRMLARMFSESDLGFGTCLTRAGVESQIARTREGRDRYATQAPEAVDAISQLFRSIGP